MNEWLHTILAVSCIYFAYAVGKAQKNKEIAAKVAKETLDRLEKENFVKYIINKNGEKEYQRVE
jgi:hypothetical protein|tara:strand:+ start:62 stop:253 length:192 start_codon:yes stop_codon:yes gene_type:complete